jgi:hypothetical protein
MFFSLLTVYVCVDVQLLKVVPEKNLKMLPHVDK